MNFIFNPFFIFNYNLISINQMKYALLFLVSALLVCCNSLEVKKKTYYRDTKTGMVLNQVDYQGVKSQKEEEATAAFLVIKEMIGDSTVVEYSIIKDYTFAYSVDRDKLVARTESAVVNLIGQYFKPFNLTTINSPIINEAMSNGKPTLINVWFIACKPCGLVVFSKEQVIQIIIFYMFKID